MSTDIQAGGSRLAVDGFAGVADVAVVVLGRNRTVIGCNPLAWALFQEGDGLTLAGTDLAAALAADQHCLQSAITSAGADESCQPCLMLVRRAGRMPLTLSVIPVHPPEPGGCTALIVVVDPERDVRKGVGAICKLYRLSDAETHLAQCLVVSGSVADAAQALHLKLATARAYLKQIFAKMGVHNQSSLVRLLLSSRVPVRNELGQRIITRPSRADFS
jgi:DNA-binding CsgD family transcriptional regulator